MAFKTLISAYAQLAEAVPHWDPLQHTSEKSSQFINVPVYVFEDVLTLHECKCNIICRSDLYISLNLALVLIGSGVAYLV
jgi:hypothetical protein